MTIYIPIWLDLLSILNHLSMQPIYDLHSNMVRFIISSKRCKSSLLHSIYIPIWLDLLSVPFPYISPTPSIYIPIWLDLLFGTPPVAPPFLKDLHSNMVRFIIIAGRTTTEIEN